MEYSSNMELEEGDLMEDAAAAATPGASGTKNSHQNSHICETLLDSFLFFLEATPSCMFCRHFYFWKCCVMWFVLIVAV